MPGFQPERRLTTIAALDVASYSRLTAEDEEGAIRAFQLHRRELVDPLIQRHHGSIANTAGDSLLVEFSSVVEALKWAMDVQQGMVERNREIALDKRIVFRIGINVGDVITSGADLLGDGVNIAARIEALAEPGGICVSRAVVDHVRGKVDVDFEDLGDKTVKNIPAPVRVFRVQAAEDAAAARPHRRALPWKAGAAAALAAALGFVLWLEPWTTTYEPAQETRMAFPLPDKPSIAVLPFTDRSNAADQAFIADGMTEDLITDLSKISGLFVIARNSSFAYRGRQVAIREVSEELGVRFVLEGSIRRAGETLRVNAELVDATTGGSVWADRFDGRIADIFALQDQVIGQIVDALELKLSPQERSAIERPETDVLEAKEAFQRGWDLYSRFNEQDNARSVAFFKRAIELDTDYGRAYGALALVYLRGSIFHWEGAMGENRATLYRELVPRYLAKASKYGTALVHVVRAMQYLFYRAGTEPEGSNRGTDDARIEAGLAISQQPNDPEALITMGWALIAAGRTQEGLSFVEAAKRINPSYPSHYTFFEAAGHAVLGDLDHAAEILEKGLARDPHAVDLAPLTASVNALIGRRERARAALEFWRPGIDAAALATEIDQYYFPIRWVDTNVSQRFRDGLLLAALPPETGVERLMEQTAAGDGAARLAAIRALGWFGPAAEAAVSALTAALGAQRKLERKEAVIALGKIGKGAAAALPALRAMADEPLIGFHAREAVRKIAGG